MNEPIHEIRLIVYALVACVFLSSFSVNVFMYKQNGRVQMDLHNVNGQIQQLEQNRMLFQNKTAMENLLKEIAAQYPRHPEVQQLLAGYGLGIQQTPPPAPAQTQPAKSPAAKTAK